MLTEENNSAAADLPASEPAQPRVNAVAAAVLRLEDEQVLAAIKELLDQAAAPDKAPPKQLLPPGFAADNGFWMADDFDEPLEDMMPYMV